MGLQINVLHLSIVVHVLGLLVQCLLLTRRPCFIVASDLKKIQILDERARNIAA
ncbi:hypothetical protein Hdeb2414_s0023g00626941 [Helianthus debilis subsp. tardiflorus]